VLSGPEVEAAFARAGSASPAAITPQLAAPVLAQLQASRVVVVTIHFLLDRQLRSLGPEANPAIGLTARAITRERVSWRNSLGVIEDDAPEAGGPKKKPLAAQASARLLWSFPRGPAATVASLDEEWKEVTGYVAPQIVSTVPNYDVLIERLRASRAGPRFRLRMDRRK
jgi:hypothetical protein